MAFKVQHTVGCDHPGCTASQTVYATGYRDANKVLRKEHGWSATTIVREESKNTDPAKRSERYEHFCPTHAQAKDQEQV